MEMLAERVFAVPLAEKIDEIQWILTVPSIWNERAKRKMLLWATKAGMIYAEDEKKIHNHLLIVYERGKHSLSLSLSLSLSSLLSSTVASV